MDERKLVNQIYVGAENKKSLVDLQIPSNYNNKLVLFVHGFMGFKDWGCWNLVQEYFVKQGFGFCKYTISHGGQTLDEPIDFHDLSSFSKNCYSYEVDDLQHILNWLENQFDVLPEICLIGHSRGGGIALLTSSDNRVKRITTWAAIDDIGKRFSDQQDLETWKEKGVKYILNSRTNQRMPILYSNFLDFQKNKEKLNIEKACIGSKVKTLVIHGDQDTSVEIAEGYAIASWLKSNLTVIPGANHTFGSSQPWNSENMPEHLEKVCQLTSTFFRT